MNYDIMILYDNNQLITFGITGLSKCCCNVGADIIGGLEFLDKKFVCFGSLVTSTLTDTGGQL